MNRSPLLIAALFCLVGSAPPLLGECRGQDAGPAVDPKAEKIIRAFSDHMQSLETFRLRLDTSVRMTGPGMTLETEGTYDVAVARPDRISMAAHREGEGVTLICDGENVYTYTQDSSTYAVHDAPRNLGGLGGSEAIMDVTINGDVGTALFLELLLAAKPHEAILENVTQLEHLGTEEIDGDECDHLRFVEEGIEFQLWITTGKSPLIRKLKGGTIGAPDEAAEGESDEASSSRVSMNVEISFSEWETGIEIDEAAFEFAPDAGAEEVEALIPEPGELGGKVEQPSHSLLGREAPPFTIGLLNGGKLDPTEHLGKHIVILDFWATWCGPCINAMPVLAEIAREYKTKGVRLYSVNLQETPQVIRLFLKRHRLNLDVALDRDGEVGKLYGADSIPETVVIGKDGRVQAVHVGFLPTLKSELTKELDTLLAGESLVGEIE